MTEQRSIEQRVCPHCGSRVYKLGCVNCNEEAYIAEQKVMDCEPFSKPVKKWPDDYDLT